MKVWLNAIAFVASFLVGLVLMHYSKTEHKTVVVFPTLKTAAKLQYKTKEGDCVRYTARVVDC
jgi:hypothetical protein